jgi:biotin carboxyl carrier protein
VANSVGSGPEWKIVVAPGAGTVRLLKTGDETGDETETDAAAVAAPAGANVGAGDVLAHIVARGGEKAVTAPHDAVVTEWLVEDGDPVGEGQPLVRLQPTEPA